MCGILSLITVKVIIRYTKIVLKNTKICTCIYILPSYFLHLVFGAGDPEATQDIFISSPITVTISDGGSIHFGEAEIHFKILYWQA